MDDFALVFLQASLACGVAGALVWGLLALASRAVPALSLQRSVWLTGQLIIAASLLLAIVPQSTQLRVLPPIAIVAAAPPPAHGVASAGAARDADEVDEADEANGGAWLPALARIWLALYCAGVLVAAGRLVRARRKLRSLLQAARPLSAAELASHPAFGAASGAQLAGVSVRETAAPLSPMLTGLLRPCLLVPLHLRSFSAAQQQLVVAHELTHWRRRDPLLLHANLILQALLWFHPAVGALGRRLNWAQELSCDQQVLAGRPQQQRQQYAHALVNQLKMQHAAPDAALAGLSFGAWEPASLTARVSLIRTGARYRHALAGKLVVTALLFALLGVSLALQPAFAWQTAAPAPSPVPGVGAAPSAALPVWRVPVTKGRISSRFGAARKPAGNAHRGMDFAVPSGTAVQAVADGTVIDSTDLYAEGERYGKVVVLEHAGQRRSLYAHLASREVWIGQQVQAGQRIGRSGKSGKVTGPHLHLEVLDNGRLIDPASMFPQ